VAGCSYADLLREGVGESGRERAEVKNLAYTAFQISDSSRLLPEIVQDRPDVMIVAHGITEALLRPPAAALRFVPPSWREKGGMDPRPYFSRRLVKRLGQKLKSAVRWRVKNLLMRRFGQAVWTEQALFEAQTHDFIHTLLAETEARIVLLTHCGIDDRFFPGSSEALERYKAGLQRIAAEEAATRRVFLCDVSQALDRWDDFFADHFHPNAQGHAKIARAIAALLQPPPRPAGSGERPENRQKANGAVPGRPILSVSRAREH